MFFVLIMVIYCLVEEMIMNTIEEIKNKLAKVAHKEVINDNDKIRELGLDSLDVVELLLELEEQYDVHFDDVDMSNLVTVKDLMDEIEKQL
ncbi:MAG TPA: acyl carrier protein [Firmicutes bacterium]|nr:acyl carrier protein [Bacillota bacterium]